jgi:uncharacterized membrane protein
MADNDRDQNSEAGESEELDKDLDTDTDEGGDADEGSEGDDKAADKEAENARLRKENEELTRKNKDLYARTQKAKHKPKGEARSIDADELERRIEEKADLRHAGYSKAEIAEAETYAKAKGISLSEAVETPFVKHAIAGLRAEEKAKAATAPSSKKGRTPNGSKETKAMSKAEKQESRGFAAWKSRQRK